MYIKRDFYLSQLHRLAKSPLIKVVVGVRRVWKSTILHQFAEDVGVKKCLIINKEDKNFDMIVNDDDLEWYISEYLWSKKYLLIDEIQHIKNWEQWILSIYTKFKDKVTIVITWSNSSLLSHEIGTKLRWRTIDIKVYPFSFEEYRSYFHSKSKDLREVFLQYLRQWGLPSTYVLPDEVAWEWVANLINTVFLQDIVERLSIKDVWLLRVLYDFIIDNIWNKLSISSLIQTMHIKGIITNYNTVSNYLKYMSDALLVYEVPFFDTKWKKIFDKFSKIYSFDHNTKLVRNSWYDIWYWKYLENYVYLTLKRMGREVFVGKIDDKEVDFIAQRNGKTIYVQVSYVISDEKVFAREFGNLTLLLDNRPKYVITCDPWVWVWFEWIHHILARDRENELDKISI